MRAAEIIRAKRDGRALTEAEIQAFVRGLVDGGIDLVIIETMSDLAEVEAAGLRGRGGAFFPTGRKWRYCRGNPGEKHYVICNADEGDPGSFMDRSVLEGNPHSVIEGMVIAGHAVGDGVRHRGEGAEVLPV